MAIVDLLPRTRLYLFLWKGCEDAPVKGAFTMLVKINDPNTNWRQRACSRCFPPVRSSSGRRSEGHSAHRAQGLRRPQEDFAVAQSNRVNCRPTFQSTAASRPFIPTRAGIFIIQALAAQGSHEHGRGATYPAVHCDGHGRTVQRACPAFHAGGRIGQAHRPAIRRKNCLRADVDAHPTVDAQVPIISQRVPGV